MTEPQWRVDPFGRADYRYWDGSAWTTRVSTDGRIEADALPRFGSPVRAARRRDDLARPWRRILVAGLLAAALGPVGLLHTTRRGGMLMLALTFSAAILTLGWGLVLAWIACIAWSCTAAAVRE